MAGIITFFAIAALMILAVKFCSANNSYEKIAVFYAIFTNFIILILSSSVANFNSMLDIIILLFLLQFIVVLFLLFNRQKS